MPASTGKCNEENTQQKTYPQLWEPAPNGIAEANETLNTIGRDRKQQYEERQGVNPFRLPEQVTKEAADKGSAY